jgi:hypothetical protein
MKTEISLLPLVIAAVIYACGLFILCRYIVQSLSVVTIEVAESLETLL